MTAADSQMPCPAVKVKRPAGDTSRITTVAEHLVHGQPDKQAGETQGRSGQGKPEQGKGRFGFGTW